MGKPHTLFSKEMQVWASVMPGSRVRSTCKTSLGNAWYSRALISLCDKKVETGV